MMSAANVSARPILFDTTRLLTRLRHPAPTGIDRVDLAYLRRYLSGAYDGRAVAVTPLGPRLMPADALAVLTAAIEERWREADPAGEADPELARVHAWLEAAPAPPPSTGGRPPMLGRASLPNLDAARQAVSSLGWEPAARAPEGAIYLHTSHLRLDRPEAFAWLVARPDIRPVFFVHDLIPIEFPEYGVPGEAERHRRRMATVARHAAGIVVSSHDVAARLALHFARESWPLPPLAVAPIGVEAAFSVADPGTAPGRPYLVVCSTIEARKNHLLLLQLWREMAAQMGDATPALVVVGRRGWESESAVDLLDRCEAIRPHVIETSGLSTAGLAALVAGSRGLLAPSFAEGYGIPVVEALASGVPVAASDIPVHREIAGAHASFHHPLDGPGWKRAILDLAAPSGLVRPSGFVPPDWAGHFAAVEGLLTDLGQRPGG